MKDDTQKLINEMADEFCRWPLPESVRADLCATTQQPGRIGTSLLSVVEAREMFRAIALPRLADIARLNWLEDNNARLQFEAEDEASLPYAVVYLPTLEAGESRWREAARGDDFRTAIDAAMKAA